ncbi:hypothetical protein [Brunnivagina elsteri]|uniref:Uncharacterized protein n=1 Tax=Brunnivagina elsteri CCALA 953 TaxID=987040 RepID=A0A2A2TBK1_9CYAN|nr:hypothetical protein [Calothrix elsteri]PAX48298.1 hypothetical protein CK510_28325 [Calothrix elsteri CCALA 953]
MPITINRGLLPGFQQIFKNNVKAIKKDIQEAPRKANEFFEDYKNGLDTLKGVGSEWWEMYRQALKEMGINNIGDFAKWTVTCVGTVAAIFGGALIISAVSGAVFGAVGGFALTTAGLMGAVTFAPIFSTLLQSGISTTNQVLNFNINQTDEELYKQLEAKVNSMYGLLGTTVGSALGWLVCGALPNSLAFRYNKAVGTAIAQDLDDDARSELYSNIAQIIRLSSQTLINSELINRFTSTRRELKRNPDSEFGKFFRKVVGEEVFKKWGDANQQAWTIKKNIIDPIIEKEKDPQWKEFKENALEGFSDSCMEASFIVANNLDTYIASQKIARSNILGKIQHVRIQLGESAKEALAPPKKK